MLSEEKTIELKSIVQRMIDAKESEANIGSVIKRFSEVNATKQPTPIVTTPEQPKSLLGRGAAAAETVLKPASEFVAGNISKVVGSAITAPILSAKGRPEEAKKLLKENVTPSNVLWAAIEAYPGGGHVTKSLKALPGGAVIANTFAKIPEKLRASAIKQYSEALGATTKELKSKTAKVVPELLKRKLTGGLEKLSEVSGAGKSLAGAAVRKAEEAISPLVTREVGPLIASANKLRDSYIVGGKVVDEQAVSSIDNVVASISQFGKEIPDVQLIKIKRLLDKSVSISNKNFTKSEGLSLATEAKQGIANSIRAVLNSNNPNLAKANKEFELWADVSKIVNATIERRAPQGSGITRFIGPLVGAGGIGATTGNPAVAVGAYFATDAAIKLLQSTAYKTISSVDKMKLAKYLESGNVKDAMLLTTKLLNGITNENNE